MYIYPINSGDFLGIIIINLYLFGYVDAMPLNDHQHIQININTKYYQGIKYWY
jgi:hypothetical protein